MQFLTAARRSNSLLRSQISRKRQARVGPHCNAHEPIVEAARQRMIPRVTASGPFASPRTMAAPELKFGSLCALGGFTPYPVMSALTHFTEDLGARPPSLEAC